MKSIIFMYQFYQTPIKYILHGENMDIHLMNQCMVKYSRQKLFAVLSVLIMSTVFFILYLLCIDGLLSLTLNNITSKISLQNIYFPNTSSTNQLVLQLVNLEPGFFTLILIQKVHQMKHINIYLDWYF